MDILVTPDGRACLGDFGLGTLVHDFRLNLPLKSSTNEQGSIHWFAPEIIRGEPKTPASDMYAFGCVLHEVMQFFLCVLCVCLLLAIDLYWTSPMAQLAMLRGRPCYSLQQAALKTTSTPQARYSCRRFAWDLMVKCWSKVPDDRPTASEVIQLITLRLEPRTPDNSMNGRDESLLNRPRPRSYMGEQTHHCLW